MTKNFNSLEDIFRQVSYDKKCEGAESSLLNRYPIRFILFETFSAFNEFTYDVQNYLDNVLYTESVDKWLDKGNSDTLITYSQLYERIFEYIKKRPARDYLIAPFSEMARFYTLHQLDSLIKTIRLIESTEEAQDYHQRIYIPIIGMSQRIGQFEKDENIHIWKYDSKDRTQTYTLILTRGTTYGVNNLSKHFNVVTNLREWLNLWKQGNNVKQNIICTSKVIFDNAKNAQPDNVFSYTICNNSYEFLTNGLNLDFGANPLKAEDIPYWNMLAECIDYKTFDFNNFINRKFDTFGINNSSDYIKNWVKYSNDFDRWLLTLYYLKNFNKSDYIYRAIDNCQTLTTPELFSNIALCIFDGEFDNIMLQDRKNAMQEAAKHNIKITNFVEQKIKEKLTDIAINTERGYDVAAKLLTPLTNVEKQLAIEWLGKEKILQSMVKDVFPELYYYMQDRPLQVDESNLWINNYFANYRSSKIANKISNNIKSFISDKNGSPLKFQMWYDNFKTVKTLLHNRDDIEMYYWIDGLGVDWIPFISYIIGKHNSEGVYLNEIHVGRAELPTTTANNKIKLQELSDKELPKIGDIDDYAHSNKEYSEYIIHEIQLVEKAINDILDQYNGKKIAIVSDHGITYLSQIANGLHFNGVASDHAGRFVTRTTGNVTMGDEYTILEDNKTMCALTHNSLTSKVPSGQGAHGGCTPEEVLVPVIIVSNQKNASHYTTKLLDNEISATNPIIKYQINGLTSIDCPYLIYNGTNYKLNKSSKDIFESERLNLVDTSKKITLCIGDFKQEDSLKINIGVEEDDFFSF